MENSEFDQEKLEEARKALEKFTEDHKVTAWWKTPWGMAPRTLLFTKTQESIQYDTPKPPTSTIPVEEFQEMWKRTEIPGTWKSRLYRQFTPDYSFWGNAKGKFRYLFSTIKMKLSGWKITRQ